MWFYLSLLCTVLLVSVSLGAVSTTSLQVVDLRHEAFTTRFSVQVCHGLFSRLSEGEGEFVGYALFDRDDVTWLQLLAGVEDIKSLQVNSLKVLGQCTSSSVIKGILTYNYTTQKALMPNIVTLAAQLDYLPLDMNTQSDLLAHASEKTVLNLVELWQHKSVVEVTRELFTQYVNKTTHLAKQNPGYETSSVMGNLMEKLDPKKNMETKFVDYVVKEKMFDIYFPLGCIPFTSEHKLFEEIVNNNPWPRPIVVYGYDNSWALAGDIFEAETYCNKEHDLGQVATDTTSNLAYFSRTPAINKPMPVNKALRNTKYNSSKTYVSLVLGDGDNIAYVKGRMMREMKQRTQLCKTSPETCFPVLWSMSSNLLYLAPSILKWFYNQALHNKNDYFILPPSGTLYAYPASMNTKSRDNFVKLTEEACTLMSTNATMDWEFVSTWDKAANEYLPLYVPSGIVRTLFAVDVPYLFPIVGFSGQYKVAKDKVVLFKPLADWQKTNGNPVIPFDKKDNLTPKALATKINKLKRGSVTYVYLTHDVGADLNDFYQLVGNLSSHVQVVDAQVLTDMAIQAHQGLRASPMENMQSVY